MPQKLPTDAWFETSETLLYSSRDAYEVDIDDKDLHIDMNDGRDKESTRRNSMTQVESTSKRKSQQSKDSGGRRSGKNNKKISDKKPKKNENTEKRRATKSKKTTKDAALVIEKTLTPDDPSTTSDISLEQRQLIEFYVNPLLELPAGAIDIG